MTRGMKGCYIFCTDEETNSYFKEYIGREVQEFQEAITLQKPSKALSYRPQGHESSVPEVFEPHIPEEMNRIERALYDVLKKDQMSHDEAEKVWDASKTLLYRLFVDKSIAVTLSWPMNSKSKQTVKDIIREVLDKSLPESYSRVLFNKKCDCALDFFLDFTSEQSEKETY